MFLPVVRRLANQQFQAAKSFTHPNQQLKKTFSKLLPKKVMVISLIYSSSSSSDSLEEEKSHKLSLICLINFFSMYLHSFKNSFRQ